MADNSKHYFWHSGVEDSTKNATNWARAYAVDPTAISTAYDSALKSTTDTVMHDNSYSTTCGVDWLQPGGDGAVGLTSCFSLTVGKKYCDQAWIRVNLNFTSNTTKTNRRALVAHEIGPSLGLTHRIASTSVMKQGYPKSSLYFDTHDKSHLSTEY